MLTRSEIEGLYTYRDPHLTESYAAFGQGPAELAARDYTGKDLTDSIVGTVSEMDKPMKPCAEAKDLDRRYFCGISDEMLAADRKATCGVDAAALKAMAAELADQVQNGVRVAFGSKEAVEAAKELFEHIETL